jgi:hypothetical protein
MNIRISLPIKGAQLVPIGMLFLLRATPAATRDLCFKGYIGEIRDTHF